MERRLRVHATDIQHSVDDALEDALQVAAYELKKLRKANLGEGHMDPTETRVLAMLIDVVVKIGKEQREAALVSKIESLSAGQAGDIMESISMPGRRLSK